MVRKRQTATQKRVLEIAKARNIELLRYELGESSRSAATMEQGKQRKLSSTSKETVNPSDEIPRKQLKVLIQKNPESTTLTTELSSPDAQITICNNQSTITDPPETTDSHVIDDQEQSPTTSGSLTIADSGTIDDQENATKQDNNDACTCGLQVKVCQLDAQVNELQGALDELKVKVAFYKKKTTDLKVTNAKLQKALVSKLLPEPVRPFKDVEGFPNCDDIMTMSMEAHDSDYMFVKFLMNAIWPDGFAGRTVTGRVSNNPKGRPKVNVVATEGNAGEDRGCTSAASPPAVSVALEDEKVQFVKARLLERRIHLHDETVVAKKASEGCNRLMQMVISNAKRR
ncbi:uncharacterized protein LOC134217851 isoform X2 [Armigeres subalbatus]|uniref:uncharacterized protein LOC134217851 isoform X2 n=1 Tax=Armigeres subalbatus TaxID=124917 RepID=UPI002ED67294